MGIFETALRKFGEPDSLIDSPSRPPTEPAVTAPESTRLQEVDLEPPPCRDDDRTWDQVAPLEMLPNTYRDQAQEILGRDPNARFILETCKCGACDCWEALKLLGIPLRED